MSKKEAFEKAASLMNEAVKTLMAASETAGDDADATAVLAAQIAEHAEGIAQRF
ncbi:MAG: hypothetical protein GXP04_08435 [Alphaproteobacteria bacterium]|nr:hypothetical protein [Alphaproteobacteria bacterium]